LEAVQIEGQPELMWSADLRFPVWSIFSRPNEPIIMSETTTTPKITAYLKTFCGWSEGVRAIMRKYELPFEEKDIIKNPAFRWEMEQRSGQSLSPCVEIDGNMLPDISGEEVEKYLLEKGYLEKNDATPDAPINSSCTDEQHAEMALGRLPVPGKIRFLD
jgi:monothiol glutaredoxin